MPYIKQSDRIVVNQQIEALANSIAQTPVEKRAGMLNYTISSLIKQLYGDDCTYAQHNEIIGMLECCKLEWYRRKSAPYEDIKCRDNGDY